MTNIAMDIVSFSMIGVVVVGHRKSFPFIRKELQKKLVIYACV
jgi:hypothetical protein